MRTKLNCAGRVLDLGKPCVMGVVNVTPDSFSDGGEFLLPEQAVAHAFRLVEEGAAIIDIGGESTRPGASAVPVAEELDRIVPIVEALTAASLSVPISVDTSKPEVMRAAVAAGAGMINDVYALRLEGALEAVADLGVPVCVMHMQGEPRTMQANPVYEDVVAEVKAFLANCVAVCKKAGIDHGRLIIDPGFGFGKTLEHNLGLLRNLRDFCELGVPVLAGISRKSMIGALLDAPPDERLQGSVAAAVIAALNGASILRVHDVRETVQALTVVNAIQNAA